MYRQCHILLKSSILESFSYPPLEMMATGGYVVVAPNDGNLEYLQDGVNCQLYRQGDYAAAIDAIKRIVSDEDLRKRLYFGGIETAQKRDWGNLASSIVDLYRA